MPKQTGNPSRPKGDMGAGVRDVKQITERLAEIDTEERRLLQSLARLRHARELLALDNDVSEDDLTFAERVTRRHGSIFAKVWLADTLQGSEPVDAFSLTGVIEYPDGDDDESPAKLRYESLLDEIVRRTLYELERPVAEAFARVASEVVERERARQERR